ncbi:xanthine dehydrogenase family protein molybdopterin-binding subunit [Roseisalinus antarcticus]|uniref:Isoquinoline 1-oxidoreductase subunit beta n=1 Tax=Roseisalinus antarcticus TaxID=254357 RepID=A0A1Y5TR05_9RHOB|nr:molybdopterin cofactor-binding domain-containing protein [Roseisalinus antarcticus]SLN68057.1 Isoquinoline 1-oxidoreductase subunit beta [Roseisalinus antarcticus]
MGTLRKVGRRAFLIGSAAIAGGVAFGTFMVARPHANPLEDGLAEDEATFNPWVKISADRITLITPHADIGQGVVHMQATLIAEELDLDHGQFLTEYGPPSPAYYNHAFAAEGAPFLSTDTSLGAETARAALGAFVKVTGLQGTGGSTSTPDSFDKLRQAGAVARETLKLAAAEVSGIAVNELKTESGAVVLPDGTRLPYTDLAATAATLDPVQQVTLRSPDRWRLIGKPSERRDVVAKSTGRQLYGIDLEVPGMVHATVRTNPRRAAMLGYDASAARDMPGVRDIIEITNGIAVLADNTWRAFQAARAVEIDWAPAPYPPEQADHWAEVARSFTEDRLDRLWRDIGDAGAALSAAEVIEAEYRTPYVAHQPLEPLNAIVRVTDDGAEVWTGHQTPGFLQQVVADVTGHEPDAVVFHNQHSGGSFGHRLELDFVRQAAEIATRLSGTPIKMTYAREEDFVQDFPRHIGMARGRGAIRDGQVRTIDIQVAAVSALRSQFRRLGQPSPGPDLQIPAGVWNAPYGNLSDFRVRAYAVPELAPTSSWRSVGASSGGFYIESFLDELIRAAGADPIDERLRLIDSPVAAEVLRTVAEMSDWGAPLGEGKGRGVALVESFGVPVAEVVEVTNTPDGIRVDKVWVAADAGMIVDPVNTENQIQGGVVWGLGHAINSEVTYSDGIAQQTNYHAAEGMRLYQTPQIEVRTLTNNRTVRGIGEPPVPPAAPALANAIFDATGQRLREMPFHNFIRFV